MSQLQHSEVSSNICHSENWSNFLQTKPNRKLYHLTCDSVKAYRRQQAKVKFLFECGQYGMAPPTCRARFTPPAVLTTGGLESVAAITTEATKALLKVAINEAHPGHQDKDGSPG